MAQITLACAHLGTKSVIPVSIGLDADVEELRMAIARTHNDLGRFDRIDPAKLKLCLTRDDNGKWCTRTQPVVNRLGSKVTELRGSMRLSDEMCFGDRFVPGPDEIHVAVFEANNAVTEVSDWIGMFPAAVHRPPDRLRRWAAINESIRQKQEETEPRSKKHTVCQERDTFGSPSWEDIKSLYNFVSSLTVPSREVPDAVAAQLHGRILELLSVYDMRAMGGNERKRLFIIAPILETACSLVGGVRILVDEHINGKNVHIQGQFEFVLQRGTRKVAVVQSVRERYYQGVIKAITGLEAVADVDQVDVTYAIVTNYHVWQFLVCKGSDVHEDMLSQGTVNFRPKMQDLRYIVGKICTMLTDDL